MMHRTQTRTRKIHSIAWYQHLLLFPPVLLFKLWLATLRVEISKEDIEKINRIRPPQIILFWHNMLFTIPLIRKKFGRSFPAIYGLVSASKDGAWLAAFFKQTGIRAIRGSANFRGSASLKGMISAVRDGGTIGITPDGSNGPVYRMKAGAAALAKACQCGMVLIGAEYKGAWRLNSWDRFFLPKPFSRVAFKFDQVVCYEDLGEEDPHKAALVLEKKLMQLQPPDPLVTAESEPKSAP